MSDSSLTLRSLILALVKVSRDFNVEIVSQWDDHPIYIEPSDTVFDVNRKWKESYNG